MKKMSFKCIFNWLYAKTLNRAMSDRQPREDRETISPVYRLVSVPYLSRISLIALLLLFLGGWNTQAWGECNYTINDAVLSKTTSPNGNTYWAFGTWNYYDIPSFEFGNVDNTYGISHISVSVAFPDLSKLSAVTEKFQLQYKIGSGSWTNLGSQQSVGRSSVSMYNSDITIAAGQKVYFKLVRVEKAKFTDSQKFTVSATIRMATTASMPETLPIGNVDVDGEGYDTFKFRHSNRNGQTITFSSSKTEFVVSPTSLTLDCDGEEEIKVTYKPTCGNKSTSATITAKYGSTTLATLTASATPQLVSQSVSWVEGRTTTIVAGESMNIEGYATSTSTIDGKRAIYYTSSAPDVISVGADGHTLTAKGTAKQSAIITAHQDDDCKFASATATQTFTITKKLEPNIVLKVDGKVSDLTTLNLKVGDKVYVELENVSDGLDGDFTAAMTKSEVVSVTRLGNTLTIEALKEDATTVTLKQTANSTIAGASKTYTINVTRIENTLALNKSADTKYIDQEVTDVLKDASINSNAAIKTISSDATIAYYDVETDKIVIKNSDKKSFTSETITIKIWQEQNVKYAASDEKIFTLTVNKYPTSFTGSAYNLMVDGTQTADYGYTNTSAEQPTANSSADFYYTIDEVTFANEALNNGSNLVTFNPSNKQITAYNAGTAKITLHQKETYKYTGAEKSFNVAVAKHDNALFCSWGGWTKTVNFEEVVDADFTAKNTNYTLCPINITQTRGEKVATLKRVDATHNTITASYNRDYATWHLLQAESYKYKAVEADVTLVVNTITTNCNFYEKSDQQEIGNGKEWEVVTWTGNYAKEISFQAAKNMATAIGDLQLYILLEGGAWQLYKSIKVGDLDGSFGNYDFGSKYFTYSLASNVRGIKFKNNGDYSRAIRNLTIKRIQYLKLSESEITMPTNTLGGNKQEATFTIDYSTCAETIKVVSNHPHITVSETSFETNGNETKTIKVTYASNVTEVIDAVITVYTPYENKTIAVHAETEKQTPEIIWNEGYQGNPISLPVGLSTDAAAHASNSQPIIYASGDPSIIAVSADGRSFEVVGKGSTTLTATSTEDTEGQWKSVSDTKNVNTTDKKIQVIVWDQTFTRGLHEGDVIPMTAKVYLQDLKTGTNTFSSERTSMLQYSISEPNEEVVEITDGYKLNILGYGETTVTASVAGDEDYEAAVSVGKQVRVREIPTGDCETPLVMAPEDNGEIEFFAYDLKQPAITKLVTIDRSKGVPDKLSFYVRGVSYNMAVEYYNNGIEVYESTDDGVTWSSQLIYAYPLKNTTGYYGPIQLSPNATHLKFFRAQGGRGYHYVGDIQITAKQFIENDYTIVTGMPQLDLQNVSAGAVKESSVDFRYSDVKGFLNASTSSSSNPRNVLTLSEDQIETECGEIGSYSLPITFRPMVVGPWQTTVTITDPKTSKSTTVRVVATVTQGSQSITWNPEKTSFGANETPNILNATASSELPVSYTITSGASVAEIPNGVVVILQPGTFTITASQNGSPDFYAAKPVTKTFTVSAIPLILTAPTASSINASQTLNESALTGGSAKDGDGNEVAGTWAWQNSSATYSAGEHTPTVVFTPSTNPAWYSNTTTTTALTVTGVEYIFTNSAGDSEWDEAINWDGGNIPAGNDKDVIIRGNLTIDDEVVVKSLTIEEGYKVTLTVGGQLTVGNGDSQDRAKYGDLHVLKEGQVVLNEGKLKVNNFILDASLNGLDAEAQVQAAASGQVTNPGNIDQQGNAYFDLSFDPSGKISYGWYDFTVPFEVNISGGISRINSATDKVMVCGTDFLIMEDDEANYVAGGKGWHQIYGGVLQPGKLYTITFDDEVNQNTFRFTWNGHGSLENGSSFNAEYHVSSDDTRTGWNALGNGMLQHGYLNSGLKVQTYDHTRNTYNVLNQHSTFAIGTAFFVQVPSAQKLNWTVAEATNDRPLYAPQREAREVEEFRITLSADEMHLSDVLYFSASEETTDAYAIGHDLVKRGTPQEAKDAQMWATKGGKNLCDIEATLYNNSASTPLSLYAPQNGQYTLTVDEAPEDANLYLTYNGSVIWDLTASPYSLDLTKGTTEGYGLQLEVINAPLITTGVDEINGEKEGNRKVLINNAMYIITKEGAIFNATGKKVK